MPKESMEKPRGKESKEKTKKDKTDLSVEEVDLLGKPLRLIYKTVPNPDPYNIPYDIKQLYWGDRKIAEFSNFDSPKEREISRRRSLHEVFKFLEKEQIDLTKISYSKLLDMMDEREEEIIAEDRVKIKQILNKLDSAEAETLERILPLEYLPKNSKRVKEHEKQLEEFLSNSGKAKKEE